MLRKRFPLFVILLLSLQTAAVRTDKVDDYVKAEMQKQRIPGLSLAVVKEGKVIKAEGYGLANVEHNVPARPETVYKIGSVSKQFIATGVMLLVQDGKIGLDEKVGKYLDGTPESWNGITIRHLLTHTSGIVRDGPGFDQFKDQIRGAIDFFELVNHHSDDSMRPEKFEPGFGALRYHLPHGLNGLHPRRTYRDHRI